ADESTAEPAHAEMIEHHRHHGDGAQSVDVGAVAQVRTVRNLGVRHGPMKLCREPRSGVTGAYKRGSRRFPTAFWQPDVAGDPSGRTGHSRRKSPQAVPSAAKH